jgi:hypothetical protein
MTAHKVSATGSAQSVEAWRQSSESQNPEKGARSACLELPRSGPEHVVARSVARLASIQVREVLFPVGGWPEQRHSHWSPGREGS